MDNFFNDLENIFNSRTIWGALVSVEDSFGSSENKYTDFKKEVLCRALMEDYDFGENELRDNSIDEAKRYSAELEHQWKVAEEVSKLIYNGEINLDTNTIQDTIDLRMTYND